jgi:predicted ABC-type ATPase
MLRRLDLVVGPNGAGKSTLVHDVLAPRIPGSIFVNADEIARQRWPEAAETHAYEAAKIAAATRSHLIASHRPFIAETVFSHPSKLDLITEAHAAGFTVILHVLLVPVDISVARVPRRVAAGGHSVPEEKIRERHRRLWPLVAEAIQMADTAKIYDSSARGRARIVARFSGGTPVGSPMWPTWTDAALTSRWPRTT